MRKLATCVALVLPTLLVVQEEALAQGVVVTADSIASARALSAANNTIDRLVEGTEVPGGKFALAVLRRVRAETNGLIHSDVTEVYYITSGSGTIVTGGSLEGTRDLDLISLWAGMSLQGSHVGGHSRRVGPGDVIVVPAGTAHRLSELDGTIEYLVFRFEAVE